MSSRIGEQLRRLKAAAVNHIRAARTKAAARRRVSALGMSP
jgi:hypothetical protein